MKILTVITFLDYEKTSLNLSGIISGK